MGGTAIDEFLERNATKNNNASSWPSFSVLQQSNVFLELDPAEMVDIDLLFSEQATLKEAVIVTSSINNSSINSNNSSYTNSMEDALASTSSTSASFSSLKKHVSFTEINIREHSVVLGDHPCCTIGLPVALGWEVQHESSQSLDDYEASRTKPRRSRHEMRLSLTDRRALLSDYSDDTVRRVSRQLHKERRVMGRRAKQQFFSHHDTGDVSATTTTTTTTTSTSSSTTTAVFVKPTTAPTQREVQHTMTVAVGSE